ncbi:hypothetical protein [Bacteroides reticulotermitis]|uniref:hypothetical protein n=1 Tax=Bacteroides reticulotermitis TaxID=1133319 RepID=UPI003A8BDA31
MNKASKLVSDSLIGEDYVSVSIKDKVYEIHPPAIKVMCRAISEFSKMGMDGEYNPLTIIAECPGNTAHIIKGISALIVGDVNNWRWKAHKVGKRLKKLSFKELNELLNMILPLLGGDAFFEIAASLKSMSVIAAKPKL